MLNSNENFEIDSSNRNETNRNTEQAYLQLVEQINKESAEIDGAQQRIYEEFINQWDSRALLKACSSCGVRAFETGLVRYENVPLEKLDILKYSPEQKAELLRIPEDIEKE